MGDQQESEGGQGPAVTGKMDQDGKLSRKCKDEEEDDEENDQDEVDPLAQKKPRVVWSIELHRIQSYNSYLPYENITPVQATVGVVQKGLRPTILKHTLPKLVDLLENCWQQDPVLRPDFTEIIRILQQIVKEIDRMAQQDSSVEDEVRYRYNSVILYYRKSFIQENTQRYICLLSSYGTRGYMSFIKEWEDAEEQGRSSNDILHAIVGTKSNSLYRQ
ncbi:hypothetical protein AgCh_009095 [Apium graveolens]